MTSRLQQGVLALSLCFCATAAHAAEAFVLPYRVSNHWVHKDDNKTLVQLMAKASKDDVTTFQVMLPDESKNSILYIERLKILRNLLMRKTKGNIKIYEVPGSAPANSIKVIPSSNLNN